MLTREEILQFLRDNKERFAEQYGVTKIGLFGSFARDEATEESDVDVCVEMPPTHEDVWYLQRNLWRLQEEIEEKTSREVDVVRVYREMDSLLEKCIKKDAILDTGKKWTPESRGKNRGITMTKNVDWALVLGILEKVQKSLMTIERRFQDVPDAEYFSRSELGEERKDGICMQFATVGDSFRQIDKQTNKTFLSRFTEIDWKQVIGFRDKLAHDYYRIDDNTLFVICQTHLPPLLATVNRMIEDLEKL